MTLPLTPDELLTTTRTVRKRLDLTRPVPLDLVRECLEIAVQAPSGSNAQSWHWVVVTDAAQRAAVGQVYRQQVLRYAASPGYAGRLFADRPDRARGLGTAWTSLHLSREAKVAQILGIPDDVHQGALIPTAYYTGETFQPAPRVPLDTVLHLNQW